ncbi:hypothetical protein BU26DRAFT_144876 [Trematosphaeria pertusa]|uniref:C2H2-type domain-containing protein n=1 Tax=Trematosphaeria pertusa TaxID=390896 RepID=A0A6A6IXL7_9PLEO|nr:uncharacterized protein BU26DRAFT_144876 [Trematosphaeria pertusa]KAF2254767.1 hypothetical protein BU26DRAFT_144876 [Trematosphaeria pertusa]
MQTPNDFDASSETAELVSFLPIAPVLHDDVPPQTFESASRGIPGYASLDSTHHAGKAVQLCGYAEAFQEGISANTAVDASLRKTASKESNLSGIADLPWAPPHMVCESPRTIWNLDGLDDFNFEPGSLQMPSPYSLLGSWASDPQVQTFEGLQLMEYQTATIEPARRAKEPPMWSHVSSSSAWTSEPTSPSSQPSIGSVSISDRRRRFSSSSRGSQSLKRRINSIKHLKPAKDTIDPFCCETCGRSFKYKKDLERHKHSVHNSQASWFCPVEGCRFAVQGFSRKDKAFQHVKTHQRDLATGIEPIFVNSEEGITLNLQQSETSGTSPAILALGSSTTDSVSDDASAIVHSTIRTPPRIDARPHKCSVSGCNTTFAHSHDLRRHMKTKHLDLRSGEGYRCAAPGCPSADKVWTRLDNFRQHISRRHGGEDVDIEALIRSSARVNQAGSTFPFTVTTPDTFSQIRS